LKSKINVNLRKKWTLIENQAQQCAQLIREARSIAALTGAGVSTNAGIPDFRGPNGLYTTKRYDPDMVFDIRYFHHDPKPFYEFAREFIKTESTLQPTETHRFLRHLETLGKLIGIVTQNIDSLHQKAGSQKVYEMHGSFLWSHCLECNMKFSFPQMKEKLAKPGIPRCVCGGLIKPDIVFFGESVKYYNEAMQLARQADLFFVIGTSCVVYPAAAIPTVTPGKIVVVNNDGVDIPQGNIILSVKEDTDTFFAKVKSYLT
jgi:NAD-dependent deacetylase